MSEFKWTKDWTLVRQNTQADTRVQHKKYQEDYFATIKENSLT